MTGPSNAYLAGYIAGRAGFTDDPKLLLAAQRLDPERAEYHERVFKTMGGTKTKIEDS